MKRVTCTEVTPPVDLGFLPVNLILNDDMEIDPEKPVPQSYTILRIKRKRNEEPLDALGRPAV
jgi:hypothetical protein